MENINSNNEENTSSKKIFYILFVFIISYILFYYIFTCERYQLKKINFKIPGASKKSKDDFKMLESAKKSKDDFKMLENTPINFHDKTYIPYMYIDSYGTLQIPSDNRWIKNDYSADCISPLINHPYKLGYRYEENDKVYLNLGEPINNMHFEDGTYSIEQSAEDLFK